MHTQDHVGCSHLVQSMLCFRTWKGRQGWGGAARAEAMYTHVYTEQNTSTVCWQIPDNTNQINNVEQPVVAASARSHQPACLKTSAVSRCGLCTRPTLTSLSLQNSFLISWSSTWYLYGIYIFCSFVCCCILQCTYASPLTFCVWYSG